MNTTFVFMGYPGCGKSSLATRLANETNSLYLSSDNIRIELYGFRDQTNNGIVFEELYKRAIGYKDKGDVYIDATNLSVKDRIKAINHLKGHFKLHLIFIIRSVLEIIQVNEERKNTDAYLPPDILKKALTRFQLPTYNEGWDCIDFYFNSSQFSSVDSFIDYKLLDDIEHDNPYHTETVKEHINYLVKYCEENNKGNIIATIASYHDIGKFFTKQYNPIKGYSQFCGHPVISAYIFLTNRLIQFMYKNNIISGFIDNLNDFLNTDYLILIYLCIYYHDLPYNLPDINLILNSFNDTTYYLINKYCKDYNLYDFAVLLFQFNQIDQLREY